MNRAKNLILKVIAPILLLVVWQTFGTMGVLNEHILPPPSKVIAAFAQLFESGKLVENLVISLFRVFRGFILGALAGVAIGIIMGLSRPINKILSSLVSIFRPIPMIAWIPLLILGLGIGEESKVAVIFIGTLWPVLLNTISGILSVDTKLIEVSRVLEKNKIEMLTKVIMPSAWPAIFTGLRLGISTAWTCVVAAEMIAASSGIGYMIMYARELSQPDVVLVGVFTIGFVGLFIDAIIGVLQKRVLSWSYINKNGR
ncbi:MAG: ABC transporter permease [Pseudobutyrivibrio sp.]|nr:ABC transporter permease [Pseudobutyrivibrio sp.]